MRVDEKVRRGEYAMTLTKPKSEKMVLGGKKMQKGILHTLIKPFQFWGKKGEKENYISRETAERMLGNYLTRKKETGKKKRNP